MHLQKKTNIRNVLEETTIIDMGEGRGGACMQS